MSVVIVVAKYKENISWVNNLQYPYIVYDKSKDIPNVGREAETYLRYILANYDKLPDYVVLLQGNPFDHIKISSINFINDSIRNVLLNKDDIVPLNNNYNERHNVYTRTKESFGALFNCDIPTTFNFPPGAQYIVSRKAILNRPKEFYEVISNVMTKINNTSAINMNNCLVCPWTIERMWPYIFNIAIPNKLIKYNDLL